MCVKKLSASSDTVGEALEPPVTRCVVGIDNGQWTIVVFASQRIPKRYGFFDAPSACSE